MDTDKLWQLLLMCLVLGGAIFGVCAILAPKNVNYYYLSHGAGGSMNNANCVYAHWTWHNDEVAFCTDDYLKALEFTRQANAGLLKPENK